MNSQLKKYLGSYNCGPVELSDHEQFDILKQLINDLFYNCNISKLDFLYDISAQEHNQLNPYDFIYGSKLADPDRVKVYAYREDLSLRKSTQKLAEKLNIHPGGIFGTDLSHGREGTPKKLYNTCDLDLRTSSYGYSDLPAVFQLRGKKWQLTTVVQYSTAMGYFVAGEAIYSAQDTHDYFILNVYANRQTHTHNRPYKTLFLGYLNKQYRLSNEDLMLDKSELPVAIFHDKRVADYFIKDNGLNFIPSSFGGKYDDISDVCLEPLLGKTVYLFPLASKESYLSLAKQAEAIQQAGAAEVLISTTPLLLHPKKTSEENQLMISDRLIRHIVMESRFVWEDGSLNKDCLPLNKFRSWSTEYGLSSGKDIENLPLFSSFSSLKDKIPLASDKYLLERLLFPGELSACIGETHSGKTMFAYTLSLGLACGVDVFCFSSTGKRPVLYIDAETTGQKAMENLSQLAKGYKCGLEELERNFKHYSIKDQSGLITSLMDEKSRQQIEKIIEETNIKVVVFDNLLTLTSGVIQAPAKWVDLSSWFKNLAAKYNVAVLFVHHLGKDGNLLGLSQIESTTRNIFTISKSTNNIQNQPGCLMNLAIEKNKEYPALDGFRATYFLELPNAGSDMGTPWRKIEDNQTELPDGSPSKTKYVYDNLFSLDVNKILEQLHKGRELSKKEVMDLLDCSDSTALNRLKSLLEKQKIDRRGEGPSTKYVLRKETEKPVMTAKQSII